MPGSGNEGVVLGFLMGMKGPSISQVFATICGLTIVGGLATAGWVVLGGQGPTSPKARLEQLTKSLASKATSTAPGCFETVGGLTLPDGMDTEDPRLKGPSLIVVRKADRRLQRFESGRSVQLEDGSNACWPVGLGPAPEGHKFRRGDGRTPEGWYRTSDKPWSKWYAAIAIHYPNVIDAEAGRVQGRIKAPVQRQIASALHKDKKPLQNTKLGGEILIHGQGATDWTLGCVGMEDADIDQLRATLPKNMRTDVLVLP